MYVKIQAIIPVVLLWLLGIAALAMNAQAQTAQSIPNAYWVTQDTLIWQLPHQSKPLTTAELTWGPGNTGLTEVTFQGFLEKSDPLYAKYPYLAGGAKFKVPATVTPQKTLEFLRGDALMIECLIPGQAVSTLSGVQTFGVIDSLFTYNGFDLGVSFNAQGIPTLKLWAPTAQNVSLHLYATPHAAKAEKIIPLKVNWKQGVWSVTGDRSWKDKFYLYEVTHTRRLEKSLVTDPYSVSLAANSHRSQIVDLNEAALKPPVWDQLKKPELERIDDIVLYELHVRDFSMSDPTVPQTLQGSFAAFTVKASQGMRHLRQLAHAGLTHIHLLPVFDFATVEERRDKQAVARIPSAPPDSELQQAASTQVRASDGYNWGYDPYHYMTPEGSYATQPEGSQRILEFRQMVQALSNTGLRVIMDVVFNHTHSAGQDERSVLDKIVPGYYYRLDAFGNIQNTSCCPDTASEHVMMEKLMVDALLLWAKQYKVDGFRFDLMGHHTRSNMLKIQQALRGLTLKKDGVDGSKIYLYGEGWQFGSLNAILPHEAMHQFNVAGTGIGAFNDRLRDTARGGNFQHSTRSDQGFVNGLYYDYNHDPANAETAAHLEEQQQQLLSYADTIRIGLAGNLQTYPLKTVGGHVLKGKDVPYRGNPGTGYSLQPQETINYVSAHDNYILWDQMTAKAPFQTPGRHHPTATPEEKARMQLMALSLVAFGQGIPFFHAGDEILRSKSGDGDSYDSGDWFNRLDFTYQSNAWGSGLPPKERNHNEWGFWKPRLAAPDMTPSSQTIVATLAQFQRYLKIRKSSQLFRLGSAEAIREQVHFLDAEQGSAQNPGVIVMHIRAKTKKEASPYLSILMGFNATPQSVHFKHPALKNRSFKLHPALLETIPLEVPDLPIFTFDPILQQALTVTSGHGLLQIPPDMALRLCHFDPINGILTLPPRSTIVLIE